MPTSITMGVEVSNQSNLIDQYKRAKTKTRSLCVCHQELKDLIKDGLTPEEKVSIVPLFNEIEKLIADSRCYVSHLSLRLLVSQSPTEIENL